MKKLSILLSILLISISCYSQDTLRYSELQTGNRPKHVGQITTYESKNGTFYTIGDKIKISTPSSNKTFAFITSGDGIISPVVRLDASSSNENTEIIKFWASGSNRVGYKINLRTKGIVFRYSIDLENAIETGEIKSSILSSDEALTELKKCKDKLDLGLITQQEFETKKIELSKYIR